MNYDNPKGDVDITYINSTNNTTCISKNHDVNVFHNFYEPLLSFTNREYLLQETEFESPKRRIFRHKNAIIDLLLKKPKSFEWKVSYIFGS